MSATQTGRSKLRVAIIVGFLVMIGYLSVKYEHYMHLQDASIRHYSSMTVLLEDVSDLGGQLVYCHNGVCQDIKTHEQVANGRDGYYIVYPIDSDVTQDIIEHQGAEIRRLTEAGQHL